MVRAYVEYPIYDFLEGRWSIDKVENTRIVRFLMKRANHARRTHLNPVTGFIMNGMLVIVVSQTTKVSYRECLLLNKKTGRKTYYPNGKNGKKIVW